MPKFYILIMLSFITSSTLFSQTCCSGGIPLSNSIGLPTANKGSLQFSLNYDYNYLNTLKNGNDKLDDRARLRTTQSILFNFGYSITKNLSFETLFTYVNQKREISQFGNINVDETYGIGNGVLLIKYNIPAKERVHIIIADNNAKVFRFNNFGSGKAIKDSSFSKSDNLIVGNQNFIISFQLDQNTKDLRF